ncbi:MAG TPA: hypothetical protein VHQ93_21195, partial [Chitinophagaceae bacterium]|nr:hypothetical protein [Chitinophagaceae bacterium]
MKSILFFILLTPAFLFAQDVNFKWVKQMVGSGDVEASTAMVVDKWGNVITTGHFSSTVDFDPGPGVYSLSGPYNDWDHSLEDMFVSKLDAAGNFIWVKHIAGKIGVSSITLDAAGNIYTVGRFQGPVDFDPGPCKYELTTLSDATDIFVLKLNPEGGFIWVKEMNAANNSYGFANCIAIDSTGNSYTTGRFHGSVDFDPGIGIYELVEPGVFSQYWYPYSMFIFKLDPDGSFVWAKQMKGTGEHYYSDAASLAFIGSGNLLTTGNFSGTVDFDSGPGTYNLTSPRDGNAFISRLDVNGNFIWVKRIAGDDTSGSWATSIKVDKSLNIITTGGFWGTNDFDPGLGVFNLTSTYKGRNNMFISKLDSVGNFIWAKGIGGTSDYNNPSGGASGGVYCTSMDLDSSGDIYSAGYFQETVDFDPGPGVYSLTNVPDLSNAIWPGFDMFISKSDSDGNFLWAKQMRTTALTYTRQTYCS